MTKKLAQIIVGEGPHRVGIKDPVAGKFRNIGDIIGTLLPYFLTLAGIIMFAFIIWGGFDILTSTGDPKRVKSGRERITYAVIGFIVMFAAYWITRIIETIFGIQILG